MDHRKRKYLSRSTMLSVCLSLTIVAPGGVGPPDPSGGGAGKTEISVKFDFKYSSEDDRID